MLRLLIDAFIALVVEETVRRYLHRFLRQCWMVILAALTWELLKSEYGANIALTVANMTGTKNYLSYILAAILGAVLFAFYWWGIQEALQAADAKAAPPSPHAPLPPTTIAVSPAEKIEPKMSNQSSPSPSHELVRKPPDVQPQTTIIQTGVPYGDLGARCDNLGNAILSYVQARNKERPDPSDREASNEWFRVNDGRFQQLYAKDVVDLHKELWDLHFRDPRLDGLLEKNKRHMDYRTGGGDAHEIIAHPLMYHLDLHEIEEIGYRLKFLSTRIPR